MVDPRGVTDRQSRSRADGQGKLGDGSYTRVGGIAVFLGAASVVAALVIGTRAYQKAYDLDEQEHYRFFLQKARMLAYVAKGQGERSDEMVLEVMRSVWAQGTDGTDTPEDAYLCITDGQGRCLLNSRYPMNVGMEMGHSRVLGSDSRPTGTLLELIRAGGDYVGGFVPGSREEQIVAYTPVTERGWLVGVHRSRAAWANEVHDNVSHLAWAFLIVCGGLMPTSLLLLAGTFQVVQRRRHRTEAALQERQARYAQAEQIAHFGHWERDVETNALVWSKECYHIFGVDPEGFDWTNKNIISLVHPEDRERVVRTREEALPRGTGFDLEHRIIRPDGQERVVRSIGQPRINAQGNVVSFMGTIHDITERKLAEDKIRDYQGQLRSLASELSLTEERQRHRIATELHDQVGQSLAVALIKLGIVDESVESGPLGRKLDDIRELIKNSIKYTRSLTFDLSPPVLHDLGLEAAIEWLLEKTQQEHGLVCHFATDGQDRPIGHDLQMLLFRSVGEVLHNVVKHARAREVNASIQTVDGKVQVHLEDDGIGFDRARLGDYHHGDNGFGLFNIRERLDHLGGRMEIESEPNRGTSVTLILPLEPELGHVDQYNAS